MAQQGVLKIADLALEDQMPLDVLEEQVVAGVEPLEDLFALEKWRR